MRELPRDTLLITLAEDDDAKVGQMLKFLIKAGVKISGLGIETSLSGRTKMGRQLAAQQNGHTALPPPQPAATTDLTGKILAMITKAPMSKDQIMFAFGLTKNITAHHTSKLRIAGLIKTGPGRTWHATGAFTGRCPGSSSRQR